MRVYMEVQPPTLSIAIHRVNAEMRKHAPAEVTFAQTPRDADRRFCTSSEWVRSSTWRTS